MSGCLWWMPKKKDQAVKPQEKPEASKGRILMVEDEEIVYKPLIEILSRQGYTVSHCADGKQAVEQYHNNWHSIDLVLLDLVLPFIDGREVFSYVNSVNPEARVIIFYGL